jgi:3',5'-cyclic AMP phosphodiesterase CpdA
MKIIENVIEIGLEKPFEVLHASDTHLALADDRDDQRKLDLAKQRYQYFDYALGNVKFMSDYAKEHNLTIVHTGDLIDFVSELNLDVAREFTSNNDVFFAAGNHEFSLYVGEAFEDEAYRNISLKKVQSAFTNDIRFSVREIGGINFVAIDNSYYFFEQSQLDGLKEVAKQGKPMVLLMHNPIYTKDFFEYKIKNYPDAAFLNGVPNELMTGYAKDRFIQQKGDAVTFKTCDYIKSEPLIKAILCGHLHEDYVDTIRDDLKQYVTHITSLRRIKFI